MELFWGCVIAGCVAALVTFLELDRTFLVLTVIKQKFRLYLLWWIFVLSNGLLAAGLYAILHELKTFPDDMKWPVRSLLAGAGYLALVRLKFATVQINQTQYSFSLEVIYEGLKEAFFRRINRIVREAQRLAITEMVKSSLTDLAKDARIHITADNLLNPEQKARLQAWVNKTETDASITEYVRKLMLANFLISGRADGSEKATS